LGTLEGLAIDNGFIYWADSVNGKSVIGRANLDGSNVNPDFITPPPVGVTTAAGAIDGLAVVGGGSPSSGPLIVDRGSFILDQGSGLQWLKFSTTTNMSYDQVVASYLPAEGWTYANACQLCSLTMTPTACNANPSTGTYSLKPGEGSDLIGCVGGSTGPCQVQGLTGTASSAGGHLLSQVTVPSQDLNSQILPEGGTWADNATGPTTAGPLGSFLVRGSAAPSASNCSTKPSPIATFAGCGMGGELVPTLPLLPTTRYGEPEENWLTIRHTLTSPLGRCVCAPRGCCRPRFIRLRR